MHEPGAQFCIVIIKHYVPSIIVCAMLLWSRQRSRSVYTSIATNPSNGLS